MESNQNSFADRITSLMQNRSAADQVTNEQVVGSKQNTDVKKCFDSESENRIINRNSNLWQSTEAAKSFVDHCDKKEKFAIRVNDIVLNHHYENNSVVGGSVLDIGCGHGEVSLYMASKGFKVTACDISPYMIEELDRLKGNLEIETAVGSGYEIPFPDNSFDTVLSRHFFPMFPDWPKIVSEMSRVCKPGGRVLLNISSRTNRRAGETMGGKDCEWHTSPHIADKDKHFHADTSVEEIKSFCPDWGLNYLRAIPLQFFHENRLIGHALGTNAYNQYYAEISERAKDPKVLDFILWFEQEVVASLPPIMTYCMLFVTEKEKDRPTT
ncbi:MAG: methyltransferase domain-containing protein [Bdellovibrionales bacterium]|nr:methyltransferase domain-containing protein [Bdellovibrionales bacterium]